MSYCMKDTSRKNNATSMVVRLEFAYQCRCATPRSLFSTARNRPKFSPVAHCILLPIFFQCQPSARSYGPVADKGEISAENDHLRGTKKINRVSYCTLNPRNRRRSKKLNLDRTWCSVVVFPPTGCFTGATCQLRPKKRLHNSMPDILGLHSYEAALC